MLYDQSFIVITCSQPSHARYWNISTHQSLICLLARAGTLAMEMMAVRPHVSDDGLWIGKKTCILYLA
jgi:hypothetical protein